MRIIKAADVPVEVTGGINSFMRTTGAELEERGHEVEYLFKEDLAHRLIRRPLRRLLIPWLIAWKILRRQRRGPGYDIVEIHETSAAAYVLLRRVLRRLDLPPCVVISYGADERLWRAQIGRWHALGQRGSLKTRLWHPITVLPQSRYALAHADHVLVSSDEDAEYVRARLGVDSTRIGRADSAVGSAYFSLERRPPEDGGTRLLFIGTWTDRKGIRELAAAWSTLSEHGSIMLTLAGTVVPERQVLGSFDRNRERVTVAPRLSESELMGVIGRHDIFILPAWFEGGAPIAAIQAAAAGLPCVVTEIGGNTDVFRPRDPESDGALLIPAHDAAALVAAVERLVSEPELARRLGRNARARAREFTWDVTAERSLAAYRAAGCSYASQSSPAAATGSGTSG
jgi:glycosyltransferase involved in cell wall biosynthesis